MKKTMKMMLGAAVALALGSAFGGALYETSVQAKVVNEASGVIDVILQNRYNDEVQRDIEFFGKNVLFLGTRCSAHSMEETTIPQSINAMAESANVRWYTCGYYEGYDENGSIKKGESMLGTMGLTSGNHSCSDKFCKILYNELVTKGNVYVLLVLEFDSVSLLSNGTGGLSAEQVGKLRAALKPYYDEGRVAWVVSPGQNPPVSAAADDKTDYRYAILNASSSGYTCPNQKNYSNVSELSQFCVEHVRDSLSKLINGHFGKDTFTFTVADGLTITETFAEFLDADGVWKRATASGVTESKYGKLVKASGGATGRTVKYEFDITGPEFAAYQANGAWGHMIRVTARCAGTDFLKPGTGEKPVLNGKGVITHEKPQDPTFKDQTTRDTLTDSDESPLISPEKVTVTFETLGHGENPAAQAVYKGTVAAEPANVSWLGAPPSDWCVDEALGSVWDFSSGVEANMTLYARWSSPRIFFDNRGGVGGANYVDATFASALPAVTPPRSDNAGVFRGCSFLGYFTEPTGGEPVYGSDGKPTKICDFTKSITLYAQWKAVPTGLPYGGDLTAASEGQKLVSGYFYNLTADLTLNGGITPENPYGSALIMPASGRVAINLNGFNLKVVGAAAEGTRGGGAGIQMNNGSVLYICGNCGTFTAIGGAAAAGVKGADGGAIWHNATDGEKWDCWSGSGGAGGAGGGGAGAGVGGIGGTGGSGAGAGGGGQNITGSMDDPWANGAPGGRGADGGASPSANFTFVCVDTLKSRTLTGGASGAGGEGGAGGGDGVSKGAEGRFRHAGAGGGGGGGAGGTAGAGCGMGGGGGGQGGGGGGGATDSNDSDHGNFNSRGGGFGGKGGKENGKDGASALQQNIKTHGKPGAGGGAGSVGAGGVAQTVYSYSSSALGDLIYAVTLDHQGGTGADSTLCYLGEVPGKVTVPVRPGYAFGGYYTEANALGVRWFNEKGEGTRRWDTDIKKLYAYWTICTYTVTFNANGGAGGTESVTITYGATMPSVVLPERTGCTFNGFFDAATGGVKYYNADGSGARTWDREANTMLYAQWAGNTYVVTLPDGTKVNVTYGQRAPNVKPATKPGYTFNGYGDTDGHKYYNADGTPTGETWSTLSDVSLVPLFTPAVYTVTLDAQGGEGGTASVTATYDALLPKVDVPALAGHTFLGYFDAAEGGKQYVDDAGNPMAAWDKDGDAALYAQWVVTTYTLTFDQQGGEGGTEYARVEYLAELPKVKIPAMTGHTFLGYFDGTDEEAVKYYESNGGSTNVYEWLENKTLSAQWKANSYKYVLDGGSFTGEQAVVYGQVPANIRVPKDEENVFMGYFDEAGNMVYDAEGHYVGGAGYAVAGNTNLKAQWSEKPEVITMVGSPKQRWPWNGKVDITYTAESLKAKNLYVVNVEMTVTEPGKTGPSTYTRLVQIPSEDGEHTLMADFGEFVAAETLDANATIRLRLFLTDSGENVDEE